MMNKKILLVFLTLIFSLSFNNVQACSLTNLTSCSFSDLTDFLSRLLPFEKKSDCPNVYAPVCSKNGKTYNNSCFLKENNEKLDYLGSCLEYPYNLSANNCVKERFEWDGYKCSEKEETVFLYEDKNLGLSLALPQNSKINDNHIELPKERRNTNLLLKKLEFVSGNYCSDISLYTKATKEEEVSINGNNFKVIYGQDSLEYGKNIGVDISYINYVLNKDDSCIGFLFSMQSEKDSLFQNYDERIESLRFNEIIESLSFGEKQERESPCEGFGDLNFDNMLNEKDIEYFNFGSVENNVQKKGDLNGDGFVDSRDQNILHSYIHGNIDVFPVCSLEKDVKAGSSPKVSFTQNFDVRQDKEKIETDVRINFDLTAENGDVYILSNLKNGMHLKVLNEEIIDIEDITWNTGAEIKDNGYIFLEKGKTTWVSIELKLRAKEKPVYTKALIDQISYLNEEGELKNMGTSIETSRFYLNYAEKGNLVCGIYGDINKDGFIKEDDIAYIVTNKELDEEQKTRADVSGNGEVNLIDAIEIQKYILKGEPFTICSKNYPPRIYDSALLSAQNNEDKTKHVVLTFYLDSSAGDALIPAKISLNQDDESSGIYLELEKDGNILVKNLKLWSSAEPTESGFLRIKKDVPNWIKIEFDVEAINDTALVNLKVNKVAYLSDGEREYIYPLGIKTGDMFLNYEKRQLLSPCDSLGDLDLDGYVAYSDYDYLKNNLNILLKEKDKFAYADLNKDGILDKLDLEELDDFLNQKIDKFSGCLKDACGLEINPVYTKDGFIYANECYLGKVQKQVKCYINNDCGL